MRIACCIVVMAAASASPSSGQSTTTHYTYDALGRLIETVQTGAAPSTAAISYDPAGNRTQQLTTAQAAQNLAGPDHAETAAETPDELHARD